jgi:2'-5' RNA ligase
MKAAIALILEGEAHAAVRRTALELHQTCGMGLQGIQLPAHVSLKQPFVISDLPALEAYFDAFASSLQPVPLTLTSFQCWRVNDVLIAFIDVLEEATLRPLHERLNHELEAQFGGTHAPFDGDEYHFHATVTIDYANPQSLQVTAARVGERFDIATETFLLGLFVYTDDDFAPLSYMLYKLARIGEPRDSKGVRG